MPSNKPFLSYLLSQITNAGEITAKPMFGEYGIYSNGKLFGGCGTKRVAGAQPKKKRGN